MIFGLENGGWEFSHAHGTGTHILSILLDAGQGIRLWVEQCVSACPPDDFSSGSETLCKLYTYFLLWIDPISLGYVLLIVVVCRLLQYCCRFSMFSTVQLRPHYDYMNYVMFSIGPITVNRSSFWACPFLVLGVTILFLYSYCYKCLILSWLLLILLTCLCPCLPHLNYKFRISETI